MTPEAPRRLTRRETDVHPHVIPSAVIASVPKVEPQETPKTPTRAELRTEADTAIATLRRIAQSLQQQGHPMASAVAGLNVAAEHIRDAINNPNNTR